jgi:hypothetical protein
MAGLVLGGLILIGVSVVLWLVSYFLLRRAAWDKVTRFKDTSPALYEALVNGEEDVA